MAWLSERGAQYAHQLWQAVLAVVLLAETRTAQGMPRATSERRVS